MNQQEKNHLSAIAVRRVYFEIGMAPPENSHASKNLDLIISDSTIVQLTMEANTGIFIRNSRLSSNNTSILGD